jgi:hypothetical protein
MDHLHERLERLEQRTHTVERQLRWWRGLACGLAVLAVLTWALPSGTAREDASQGGQRGLPQRVAALEELLKHFSRKNNEVFITGANLHIINGLEQTGCGPEDNPIPDCPNGLGNLIVGYNELRDPAFFENIRTGSHNVVVGTEHNFSRFGGVVVGFQNEISGEFASVTGGTRNIASGFASSISGGQLNTASEFVSSISGGQLNTASGNRSWIGGGSDNTASGEISSIIGGEGNVANGPEASISGGARNIASGDQSSVSGGERNEASGAGSSVSGGESNTASSIRSSVSGGFQNTTSGFASSVSGGRNRTAAGDFDWVAGTLIEDE